jgi:hypothetical protein
MATGDWYIDSLRKSGKSESTYNLIETIRQMNEYIIRLEVENKALRKACEKIRNEWTSKHIAKTALDFAVVEAILALGDFPSRDRL